MILIEGHVMIELDNRLRDASGKKFEPGFNPADYRPVIRGLSDLTGDSITELSRNPDLLFSEIIYQLYFLLPACEEYPDGDCATDVYEIEGIVSELNGYCRLLAAAFGARSTRAETVLADWISGR